jgi:hypothetical protein
VSRLDLTSIVLRSNPQVSGAPEKAVTQDSWLSVTLWRQDLRNCDEVGERGKGSVVHLLCTLLDGVEEVH